MSARTAIEQGHDFKLKALSKSGIDTALTKAEHYRLLNQPRLAESICRDILEIDKDNQKAITVLLLSLSDQFGQSSSKATREALELAGRLKEQYARIYYTGIIHERQGTAALEARLPGGEFDAYEWYREAMEFFEKAQTLTPESNNDPILRWNTCARIIMQHDLRERPADDTLPILE